MGSVAVGMGVLVRWNSIIFSIAELRAVLEDGWQGVLLNRDDVVEMLVGYCIAEVGREGCLNKSGAERESALGGEGVRAWV